MIMLCIISTQKNKGVRMLAETITKEVERNAEQLVSESTVVWSH